MKLIKIIILCLSLSGITIAQDYSFTMEISNDTVPEGNHFIVRYKLVNINGEFIPPEFADLLLLSGPMSQSVYSVINGKTLQEYSYTYYLRPLKPGKITLGKAKVQTENDVIYTCESHIICIENPENIVIYPSLSNEDSSFSFGFDDPLFIKPDNKKQDEKRKKLNIRRL